MKIRVTVPEGVAEHPQAEIIRTNRDGELSVQSFGSPMTVIYEKDEWLEVQVEP